MFKGSKIYSVFRNRCPRCQEGNFFQSENPYHLKGFDKMNKKCTICGENFEREVGFYYGAMYITYALTVLLGILWFGFFYFFFGFSALYFILSYIVLLFILFPILFRTGRLGWINLFVKYDVESRKK